MLKEFQKRRDKVSPTFLLPDCQVINQVCVVQQVKSFEEVSSDLMKGDEGLLDAVYSCLMSGETSSQDQQQPAEYFILFPFSFLRFQNFIMEEETK
jgi:hypothetical protein